MLCCQSGAEIYCTDPMHQVLEALPAEDFLSISRSAIVRRDKIVHISSSGVYTMADGKTFQHPPKAEKGAGNAQQRRHIVPSGGGLL